MVRAHLKTTQGEEPLKARSFTGSSELSILILAAGKGTRMKSDLPKVMHKIAGREMLNMVIDEAQKLSPKNITIVVGDEMKNSQQKIQQTHPKIKINFVLQRERKGTGHAVKIALENLRKIPEKILILYGDTPLISAETLKKMIAKLDDCAICILGFETSEENSYGRLVVDAKGNLEKIIEFKDADKNEKKIRLCNSGVMAVDGAQIQNFVAKIKNQNAAGEFYLTDIVAIANSKSLNCCFIPTSEEEVLGVNSRFELAKIELLKQQQLRKKIMDGGATLLDPSTVHFSFDSKISSDVIIHPHVVFGEKVVIEKNVEVKSFCHIEGAEIASGAVIGPFARIRPESKIAENVRIGNFVEIKKSAIKSGAKINHLSYVGDSEIGEEANIGAGTITCNYDGHNKFKTKIGKNVFIGSNSALVAPVEIGDGAVIGAGSVITKNVAKDDLAIGRAKQIEIKKGGKKFHQNKSKKNK